jgi:hypothetical protein
LLPDLIQVNFFVDVELVNPALVQAAPADGDAADAKVGTSREIEIMAAQAVASFLMAKVNPRCNLFGRDFRLL